MRGAHSNGGGETSGNGAAEIVIKGRSVSRGIAIGRALCLFGSTRQFYRVEIADENVQAELARLHRAVRVADRQLSRVAALEKTAGTAAAGILDAQRLMLEDQIFLSDIENLIREKRVNAEWAVKETSAVYIARYKALEDERLRERYVDIEDVSERVVSALGGSSLPKSGISRETVIAAHELRPSTLAELNDLRPAAIITEHGGWTSHTFILARELGLPAVTGARRLLRKIKTGDKVIVDGYKGIIVLNPSLETAAKYENERKPHPTNPEPAEGRGDCCSTLDSREITIRANLDIPSVYRRAARLGAKGIGLYRSEFLFNQFRDYPSESQQYRAYCAIADFAGADGVRIRTFDVGATQLVSERRIREKNPALGLRAVRLSMVQEMQFRTQIRSLLRASAGRSIDVIIPMIDGPSEVKWVRAVLDEERTSLQRRGIEFGTPGLGAMIEVPSAVLMIQEILAVSDFLSLGTNDLVQYLLAADRDNESVAGWFRTLHPAVLRAVHHVIAAAQEAKKPLIVCGEMAGSPFYLPVLIGLGATELSMSINSIRGARRVIAGIAFDEAAELALSMNQCATPDEAEHLLAEKIGKDWQHLFPPPAGEKLA